MSDLELTRDLRRSLQEVVDLAVNRAAGDLSRNLHTQIHTPASNINLIDAVDVTMTLEAIESAEKVTVVTQAFYGAGVSGESVLMLNDASVNHLSELMLKRAGNSENEREELVLEMSSLLNGTCVYGICDQLDISVMFKHPHLFGKRQSVSDLLGKDSLPWKKALAVELNYVLEGADVSCDLMVLFHEDSLSPLFDQLSYLID